MSPRLNRAHVDYLGESFDMWSAHEYPERPPDIAKTKYCTLVGRDGWVRDPDHCHACHVALQAAARQPGEYQDGYIAMLDIMEGRTKASPLPFGIGSVRREQ